MRRALGGRAEATWDAAQAVVRPEGWASCPVPARLKGGDRALSHIEAPDAGAHIHYKR